MACLIDSSIYLFRAWQSSTLEFDSFDRPVNVVAGFARFLTGVLEALQPTHVACAFDDNRRAGVRRELYPAYKADRPPVPSELAEQILRCHDLAADFGLPVFGSARVEADDIIGHFARCARRTGRPVTIITGDKDLAQFVGPDDLWWDFDRHEPRDATAIEKRYRVRPDQVADWLALAGDTSDNIAGVPGVGSPTAARLLRRWGDLDTLYANVGSVAGMGFRGAPRVAVLLVEHEASVRLARRLTGLVEEPALPDDVAALEVAPPDRASLAARLEAHGIIPREALEIARRATSAMARGADRSSGVQSTPTTFGDDSFAIASP